METIIKEVRSCLEVISIGSSSTNSIPYLSEKCHHDLVPKRNMKSKTMFCVLSDDELTEIFSYLDCKSLIKVSQTCSTCYHIGHTNILWKPWVEMECKLMDYLYHKKSLRTKEQRKTETSNVQTPSSTVSAASLIVPTTSSTSAPQAAIVSQDSPEMRKHNEQGEETQEENYEEIIRKFYNFYKPSQEEALYIRYEVGQITNDETSITNATLDEGDEDDDDDGQNNNSNNASVNNEELNSVNNDGSKNINNESENNIKNNDGSKEEEKDETSCCKTIDPYNAYTMFRTHRISNPLVRSKLKKKYVSHIKRRYSVVTKYLNHVKFSASILLLLFTSLFPIWLDSIVFWPLYLIYAPFALFSILMAFLTLVLWSPTLHWPLSLYRWVIKDNVGWWTSWAYALSVRGRFAQLITGILVCLAIFSNVFVLMFPHIVFSWLPFVILALAFFIWIYTPTQIIYKEAKRFYQVVLFGFGIGIALFNSIVVSKMLFLDDLLKQTQYSLFRKGLPWSITCIPLYIAFISLITYQLKLSVHLNRALRRNGLCFIWNANFMIMIMLITAGGVMVILRADEVVSILPYTVCCIPFFLLNVAMILYYYLRTFTNKIKQPVLKNPFTVFHGGVTNSTEMDEYIV